MKPLKLIATMSLLALMTACGGGGETDAATSPSTTAAPMKVQVSDAGLASFVNDKARVVHQCQVCTTQLESVLGPKCASAQSSVAAHDESPAQVAPPMCTRVSDTDTKASAVSLSATAQCMTFFFDNGGELETFQYCW